MSKSRDIAKFAGSSSVFNYPTTDGSDGHVLTTDGAGNLLLEAASGGGAGVTSYTNASDLPLSGNTAGDLAYVNETGRLYVNNGTGWYNVSLVNTNPSITSVLDASSNTTPFTLTTDGTATVITITASDPEDVPLTYSYSVTSGSLTNGGGTTATVTQGTGSNTNVFTVTPSTTEAYAGNFTLTFTVSDGVNTSTSANAFSLNFITTIANSRYTSYLLKADASQSDNQVDASSNSLTITETGQVKSTAFSPYHPKGYSAYFDGAGDSLEYNAIADIAANQDFTVEFWVFIEDVNLTWNMFYSPYSGGSSTPYIAYHENDNQLWITDLTTDTYVSWTPSKKTWYHLAFVRSSNTFSIYIDGTSQSVTNSSNSGAYFDYGSKTYIGRWGGGTAYAMQGYVHDLRVVKGTAVYTSNFTPPTEQLEAITNTHFLGVNEPYLVDKSSNAYTVSAVDGARTQQFGPYDHDEYTPSSHGGSVYFDGSTDRLEIADGSAVEFGTGDFTVECWVYKTQSFTNYDTVWSKYNNVDDIGYWLHINNSGALLFGYDGFNFETSTETLSLNTWHHIAAVRDSGTLKVYLDGTETSISLSHSGDTANTTDFWIGGMFNVNRWFEGYISDFRIVKGTAVYTSNFTPPSEPLTAISNTQLLTCTNKHDIWDASTGRKLQIIGSPEGSTTQYKWSNSIYFDDTSAIYSDLDPHGGIGTRDYTWEAWVYPTNVSTESALFSFGTYNPGLYIDTSLNIVHVDSGTGQQVNTAHGMSNNTWYHVAACRDGTNLRVFIDGTQVGSTGTGYNVDIPRDTLRIGAYETGSSYRWNGYMEDVRLTIGLARYTSNFTPPTAALEA